MIGLDAGDVGLAIPALSGIAYLGLSLRAAMDIRVGAARGTSPLPPISVLKPLCGDEPRLYECLRSFCRQDYPDYQIVFGVHDAADPAVSVVERLRFEFPERDITLVCDASLHGPNLKISNVINILPACRHAILAVSDSDVEIARDGLRVAMAGLDDPTVGAVSCLYRGRPTAGLLSRLGAHNINGWIVPSILLDRRLNGVEACLGPLLLLRRESLESIGGFSSVSHHLAEDHEIGARLLQAGWQVRLSLVPIDTMVDETSLADLFRHELRWAHTVRAVRPLDHVLSLATVPLPLILLMLAVQPTWGAAGLVAIYLGMRFALTSILNTRLGLTARMAWWMVPIRECLSFAVWAASLVSRSVVWRGNAFRLMRGGRLMPAGSRLG